jgi:hypothetical protein
VKLTKDLFTIQKVDKAECKELLLKYHYLKDHSKGFKSGVNYGLFLQGECVGICIYTGFPVPELVKGMFNLERDDQQGMYELSRLVLHPKVQKEVHNLASWFVSRTLKMLRKEFIVRAVLSYADEDFHTGVIYRACNFKYYGLTEPKKDFWIKTEKGSYEKRSRGATKGIEGEWRTRSRKHRFLLVFDKNLKLNWIEIKKELHENNR